MYKKRSAKEALLAEKKLVVNDTARARKSPTSGLFVPIGNYSILHKKRFAEKVHLAEMK